MISPDEALGALERVTERYRSRRSYQAEFAREIERLSRDVIESARLTVEIERARLEGLESGLTLGERRRLERAEAERDQLRVDNSGLQSQLTALSARVPVADHKADDVGTVVTFNNPKDRYDRPLPWTVGELEAIAYHLRVAGATDTTPVEFERYVTKSVVPWPDLLDLRRVAEVEEAEAAPLERAGTMSVRRAYALVIGLIGLLALVSSIVAR